MAPTTRTASKCDGDPQLGTTLTSKHSRTDHERESNSTPFKRSPWPHGFQSWLTLAPPAAGAPEPWGIAASHPPGGGVASLAAGGAAAARKASAAAFAEARAFASSLVATSSRFLAASSSPSAAATANQV